ncbi:MAG: transporter [Pseudomonadota bacterium]
MSPIKFLTFALASLFSFSVFAQDETGVSPYRPSVSSPAQLPLAGQLEFELGVLRNKTDNERRDSLPYLFKLAMNTEWGILIGGESYVSSSDEFAHKERGIGDTSIVLKRAFILDDSTAMGLEFGTKLATAKDTIGSGKTDYTVNAILSKDIEKLHFDGNLNITRLGLHEDAAARNLLGWAASFSYPLADKWQVIGEPSGSHQNGKASSTQILTALAYSPNKQMTIDFGIAKGLNKTSLGYSLFAGLVLPVAKLW